jgi:hypothetical protein
LKCPSESGPVAARSSWLVIAVSLICFGLVSLTK